MAAMRAKKSLDGFTVGPRDAVNEFHRRPASPFGAVSPIPSQSRKRASYLAFVTGVTRKLLVVGRHPERESRDLGGWAAPWTCLVPHAHPGPSTHARDDDERAKRSVDFQHRQEGFL